MSLRIATNHLILIAGVLFMVLPVAVLFLSSTHSNAELNATGLQLSWGGRFFENYMAVLTQPSGRGIGVAASAMLMNSIIMGVGVALGSVVVSLMTAYAIVYFRFRFGLFVFWLTFVTLLLPLETRIVPSYAVIAELGLIDSYSGLIFPLIASGLGTFVFRQFLRSVPEEMLESARLDGAGPLRFLIDILVPISRPMIAAVFIIMFINGWNQYLWPLMITTDENLYTVMIGIRHLGRISANGLALTFLAMLPPVAVLLFFQRWFVRGLLDGRH